MTYPPQTKYQTFASPAIPMALYDNNHRQLQESVLTFLVDVADDSPGHLEAITSAERFPHLYQLQLGSPPCCIISEEAGLILVLPY